MSSPSRVPPPSHNNPLTQSFSTAKEQKNPRKPATQSPESRAENVVRKKLPTTPAQEHIERPLSSEIRPYTYQTFLNSQEPVIFSSTCRESLKILLKKAIISAQTSVFIRAFRITSMEIVRALGTRASQGLDMRIIFQELHYTKQIRGENTVLERKPRHNRSLMHQKVLVADNLYTWIGSPNFTDASLCHDDNTLIAIQSSALAQFVQENTAGSLKINGQRVTFFVCPRYQTASLSAIKECIQGAHTRIQLIMYALTSREIIQELKAAHQRGVQVTIITDHDYRKPFIQRVQELNCEFEAYCDYNLHQQHNKICIVDNHTCITGSMNWTSGGLNRNSETLLILRDLTQEQQRKCSDIWLRSLQKSQKIYFTKPSGNRHSALSHEHEEQPSTSTTAAPQSPWNSLGARPKSNT